jgi:hypothetical protein
MEILAPYAAQEAAYCRNHHYRRCYSASPVGESSKNFRMVAGIWMTTHSQSHSIAVVIKMSLLRKVRDLIRGSIGFQGIPELLAMRGPISSLARQLQRDDTGERLLHGSKNGSHSILQSQKILKLIKAKKLLLPQHRRNPSWIELRIGSLGLLHRFGLGVKLLYVL